MAQERKSFDIKHEPALMRLVEEVRASGESRLLRIDDRTVAVLQPVSSPDDTQTHEPRRQITETDREAFNSAAGSWRGIVGGEQLKKDIYASRDASILIKAPGAQ